MEDQPMRDDAENTGAGLGGAKPSDRPLAPALRQLDQWARAEGDGGAAYWQSVLDCFGSVAALEAWANALGAELRANDSFEEATGFMRVLGRSAGAESNIEDALAPSAEAFLFLDFDGTMHPDGCQVDQLFSRMAELELWLRRYAEVGVVISSSWRAAHPLDELRGFFSDDLRQRILGITPIAAQSDWASRDGELLPIRFEREAEVIAWLRMHGATGRPWAALDDQAWRFRPFCTQLVVCDPRTVLTELELQQAARVLDLDPSRDEHIG